MIVFAILLTAWMALIVARLYYLQVKKSKPVFHAATVSVPAPRGRIYDSFNKNLPLALNLPAWDIAVDYLALPDGTNRTAAAEELAEHLGKDIDEILDKFNKACERKNRGYPLGRTLNYDIVPFVTHGKVNGIPVRSFIHKTDIFVRDYPQGERLSQVLGHINFDGIGAAGIERAYDSYLRGAAGQRKIVLDAHGAEVREMRGTVIEPTPGADIHLTIDSRIQFVMESQLRKAMTQYDVDVAWGIMQRVSTGEILAIASMPDFNLNDSASIDGDNPCKRCCPIEAQYEPGSTMKTLTVSGALNEGLVTPETRINVENRSWYYGGFTLHDHPTGIISVTDIIAQSSNIGTAKIALELGDARLEGYLRALGVASVVGIGLPETRGMLQPHAKWSKVSPTRIGIGQGVAVTAAQMVGAYATIANGGTMMQPYIVDRIVANDGTVLKQNKPRVKGHPLRPETAAKMCMMLEEVARRGTAKNGIKRARREEVEDGAAAIPNYRLAGKTGTAQMVINGAYSSTHYWATFAGFAPADHPEFAMVLVFQNPKGANHQGGNVAAPVFAKIADIALQYLAIPPSEPHPADIAAQ